jgi:hypothetical protein
MEYQDRREYSPDKVLIQPFFASACNAGSILVKLYPMENIVPGKPVLATFGVPFTKGSMPPEALKTLRILKNGSEIPSFVEMLTPWRHMSDSSKDCKWVRIARVQISYTFSSAFPDYEVITVEWGKNCRQMNISTFKDPRKYWHMVASGTFAAEDRIFEPDVYAVLPRDILCSGVLKTPMNPFPSHIGEKRDNPSDIAGEEFFTDYISYDYASKNFFYTIINEDDPKVLPENLSPYKNFYEPWLYDRSASMFVLYFRSGFLKPLREAVRSTQYYIDHVDSSGYFTLKGRDAKYSYNECLAYTYWLTGDDTAITKVPDILQAFDYVPTRWDPRLSFWTERHPGFKLLAYAIAYELSGGSQIKNSILDMTADFFWHQNGAGGILPPERIDGGVYHLGRQHGPEEVKDQEALITSPWMSVLLQDAMLRCYSFSESMDIADFIRRMGFMFRETSKTDSKHNYTNYVSPQNPAEPGELTYPDYLMRYDGASENRSIMEHDINIACALAWSAYFSFILECYEPTFTKTAISLYHTYTVYLDLYTRPDNPEIYRRPAYYLPVRSMRRYGWQYRTSASFSWLMGQLRKEI